MTRTNPLLPSTFFACLVPVALAALCGVPSAVQAEETVGRSGSFVSAKRKSVVGTARIVTRDGLRYVQLVDDFVSDDGPDLYLLLHEQVEPKSYKRKYYTELGRLQKTSGGQWYAIPAEVDVASAGSVVVRCKKFGVTFGYAPFEDE